VVAIRIASASPAGRNTRSNTLPESTGSRLRGRQLINEHGNSREVLDREAEKLKREAG
jgi:hypothetical protein